MNPDTNPVAVMPAAGATALDLALARLAASRARLLAEFSPPVEPGTGGLDAQGQPQTGLWPHPLRALWRRGRRALKAWPVADLGAGLVQDWWRRHPWRSTGEALFETARNNMLPLVKRHPLSALLGAATLGGLLVMARAWRWPALRKAHPPSTRGAARWVAAQLANPTVQTALLSAVMLLVKQGSARGEASASAPAPAASPASAAMPPSPPSPPSPTSPTSHTSTTTPTRPTTPTSRASWASSPPS